jgi:alginate O-acetyltransferase complex protein AlgI
MVFSSLFFLWVFLPIVLIFYFLFPRNARNGWLLVASLAFYAYGEGWYTLVMGAAILFNWLAALRKWPIAFVVATNLATLFGFKYLGFFSAQLGFTLLPIHLPIGISFFIFQAMSYAIDVHRNHVPANRSPWAFGTYLALFPQLIAGPIVRYAHVADQLDNRKETLALFASGVERFILGLAKKVLLANTLARGADYAFNQPATELGAAAAWAGALCYTLQIYFDFSGYSDMAIGLGRMFGFRFLENFNLPYAARSIQDFWRRWHISLSTWFRDYLYIPLGGNRKGPWIKARNQLIVFALCGFWHGASWNFLLWGIWHGAFLGAESLLWGRWMERRRHLVSHVYALLAIIGGWVLFRAETLGAAGQFYQAMLGLGKTSASLDWSGDILLALLLGSALALGWPQRFVDRFLFRYAKHRPFFIHGIRAASLLALLSVSLIWLAGSNHNPFIYFRF